MTMGTGGWTTPAVVKLCENTVSGEDKQIEASVQRLETYMTCLTSFNIFAPSLRSSCFSEGVVS